MKIKRTFLIAGANCSKYASIFESIGLNETSGADISKYSNQGDAFLLKNNQYSIIVHQNDDGYMEMHIIENDNRDMKLKSVISAKGNIDKIANIFKEFAFNEIFSMENNRCSLPNIMGKSILLENEEYIAFITSVGRTGESVYIYVIKTDSIEKIQKKEKCSLKISNVFSFHGDIIKCANIFKEFDFDEKTNTVTHNCDIAHSTGNSILLENREYVVLLNTIGREKSSFRIHMMKK